MNETTTTTLTGIAVTHDELRSIATLIHAASKDQGTPVISGVHVRAEGRSIIAVATDRYRVAELTLTRTEDYISGVDAGAFKSSEDVADGFEAIIPTDLLTRAIKQLPRKSILPTTPSIAVLYDSERNMVTIRDTMHGFDVSDAAIRGNYPPVARLFPDVETMTAFAGALALKPAYLATLEKLRLPNHEREAAWQMRTNTSENPNKPAPVLFTIDDSTRYSKGGAAALRYLLQPNLILR